ncbi:EAL domain-containing protein [Nitrosophilus kaiyonis]|uniref:EAL domain-containing protein n=1 Tax=Nitrosophilus kaiyonis TaxID=2930200 RepID=UPI0024900597|nr:bifunctional diguanylate cyclase/phosphodiesterase [Nitrosophilus kaiyonis]
MFNINRSISNKLLFYFLIISVTIILSNFFIFEKLTKNAFLKTEKEKAQLIANTVKPFIELDIYLGLENNIDKLLKDLIKNENILSVKIFKKNKLFKKINKFNSISNFKNSIFIQKKLFQPNSKKIIGSLEIIYSSKHYENLVKTYQKYLILYILVTGILLLLYGLYLTKTIKPLTLIAKDLKKYTPKKILKFDYIKNKKDEIGSIVDALKNMQEKIFEYSKKQENINKILEKKVLEKTKELRDQLYIDSLTGLPNRFSLLEDIKSIKSGSLIIMNIDDFKEINDYFGQETGDKILKGFANRLRNLIKTKYPKIYRLSGDEFALLFDKKLSNNDLTHFIELLLNSIEKMTFFHQENELNIRVTIGATNNMQSPLEKADIALKLAKKDRLPFRLYHENFKVETQYKNSMNWVKKIKKAIDKDKIVPYFQPIYSLTSENIKGYECLMRLIDENGKIITPYNFLNIAKKSRFYHDLTRIVFEKSCKHFKDIECIFSFNLSIEDILDENTIEFISQTIKKYSVEKKIIFEIVESEGIENYEDIADFIQCMKKIGAKIAIDDFGSGYSNFEYLTKLDIDFIKIDGSLIKDLDKNSNALIVVETIVGYAKKRGIKTVAEFVNNKDIYQKVKELDIDYAQGFYLAKPSDKTVHKC